MDARGNIKITVLPPSSAFFQLRGVQVSPPTAEVSMSTQEFDEDTGPHDNLQMPKTSARRLSQSISAFVTSPDGSHRMLTGEIESEKERSNASVAASDTKLSLSGSEDNEKVAKECHVALVLFSYCRRKYERLYKTHVLSGACQATLKKAVDKASDSAILLHDRGLCWAEVDPATPFREEWENVKSNLPTGSGLFSSTMRATVTCIEILYGYCQAHMELLESQEESLTISFGPAVRKELATCVEEAHDELENLYNRSGGDYAAGLGIHAANMLLFIKSHLVQEAAEGGMLEESDVDTIAAIIDGQHKSLTQFSS
eukprot:GHVN01066859.1.p1 GENE.GHVN01066859.1~~GHVN01066859.1.p1  ORF type:complete len:314 (-),score=48.83 GHVN01066859.1:1512-2453(-)